jgi:hypothetical protein
MEMRTLITKVLGPAQVVYLSKSAGSVNQTLIEIMALSSHLSVLPSLRPPHGGPRTLPPRCPVRPGGVGMLVTLTLVDELIYGEQRNEVLFVKCPDLAKQID